MKTSLSLATAALVLFAVSGTVLAQQAAAPLPAKAAEHFKSADTDGDGFISRAEAEKAMPRLAQRFDAHDTDKDGKLSPAELHGAGGMRGGHHGGRHHRDMHVTRAELVARHEQMLKHFDSADTNHDGVLSPEERKAAHDSFHAARKAAPAPASTK
ncbi:MAG: EF-hand domain-containing protein [Rhodocyclaceae bacterium]